jgi:O-acetyl-ADP-ribose deacetylase (regulator of RNase III)/NAD-dependent SIR2 family protein deacetylase
MILKYRKFGVSNLLLSLSHIVMESLLDRTVKYLVEESHKTRGMSQHLAHMDSTEKLRLLQQLLCIRSPEIPLPPDITQGVDGILAHQLAHRNLVSTHSIPTFATAISSQSSQSPLKIKLWRGDITTLRDVTAITNAANAQMLGCFQPTHRCIDNVIHAWAGPRLRQECYDAMSARGSEIPTGHAVATSAYNLPCEYIIHTVGPQLERGMQPTSVERQQLRLCYTSVLDEVDRLPKSSKNTDKSVAFCAISTGLFAFPARLAAEIAIEAVAAWIDGHPDTSITEIVFVAFKEADEEIYAAHLSRARLRWTIHANHPTPPLSFSCGSLAQARRHLLDADTIVVTAGAGMSAAIGLDYTSTKLFKQHFPTFLQYGFTCLYDVFGFAWPSERERWSYYFTHLELVRKWPKSSLYADLVAWLQRFGANAHVRTSNADGLFAANGWSEDRISTPQGQYAVLQCMAKCTPDSYWPAAPYQKVARKYMDTKTQRLTDDAAIPTCRNCGGDMSICVRAADWFNEKPYGEGEARWRKLWRETRGRGGTTTILEIGVGMNTPGVIRWPNEDRVREADGKVRLVRLGLGLHANVPWDLEDRGLATYIDGDVRDTLPMLLRSTGD